MVHSIVRRSARLIMVVGSSARLNVMVVRSSARLNITHPSINGLLYRKSCCLQRLFEIESYLNGQDFDPQLSVVKTYVVPKDNTACITVKMWTP